MNRRIFLGYASTLTAASSACAATAYQDFWQRPRELWIQRAETGEHGRFEYWRDGKLQMSAWLALQKILRDVQANVSLDIDVTVIDIAWGVQEWVKLDSNKHCRLRATSGVRVEATNSRTPGASAISQHEMGKAIDGALEGISLNRYAKAAQFFKLGGVGLYPTHVHVDSGRVRHWGIA